MGSKKKIDSYEETMEFIMGKVNGLVDSTFRKMSKGCCKFYAFGKLCGYPGHALSNECSVESCPILNEIK